MALRSLNADVSSHVQFFNTTNRSLYAYWIDYEGQNQLQFILKKNKAKNVNTFLTHPWFFRDAFTGEIMQINHLNIFLPQFYTIPNPRNPAQRIPYRKQIKIHLPLQTLKDICLWKVGALIKEHNASEGIVDQLEIPLTLKMELKLMLKLRARLQIRLP